MNIHFNAFQFIGNTLRLVVKHCPEYQNDLRLMPILTKTSNLINSALTEPKVNTVFTNEDAKDIPEGQRDLNYVLSFHQFEQLIHKALVRAELEKPLTDTQRTNIKGYIYDLHCEFCRLERCARPDMGLKAWLVCDDVGISSRFMITFLDPDILPSEYATPVDLGDFERCRKALHAVHGGDQEKLAPLREVAPVWNAIIDNWDNISNLMDSANEHDTGLAQTILQKCLAATE
jgi:hypothetical protein